MDIIINADLFYDFDRLFLIFASAELQTHFGPSSECEGAEKEDEVDEEEAEFVPVLVPHAEDSGAAADHVSAPSVLQGPHSQDHQRSHHQLSAQLGRLKQETSRYRPQKIAQNPERTVWMNGCAAHCRLLEELLQKEKEYQQVLKSTLQQRTNELELVKVRHRPLGKHQKNMKNKDLNDVRMNERILFFQTYLLPPYSTSLRTTSRTSSSPIG